MKRRELPARPDRNATQTLISEEPVELNGLKFNYIYRSNSKLWDIKAPKHSAGAFGQKNRFSKVHQKIVFVL